MRRRDFLQRAASAAIGSLVLDPERLLWVPGAKTIVSGTTMRARCARRA